MFSVYILQSESSGRYYVGHTKALNQRVAYHNANYSRALKNRGPWKLIHSENYATRAFSSRFLWRSGACRAVAQRANAAIPIAELGLGEPPPPLFSSDDFR